MHYDRGRAVVKRGAICIHINTFFAVVMKACVLAALAWVAVLGSRQAFHDTTVAHAGSTDIQPPAIHARSFSRRGVETALARREKVAKDAADEELLGLPRLVRDPNDENGVTIVTCYFDLSSFRSNDTKKHSHSTYVTWSAATLETPSPMVIYTDRPHLFAPLRTKVDSSLTRIVAMNFTDLPYVREHFSRINTVFSRDDKRYGGANLPAFYALWYNKIQLIKMAIEANVFRTPRFLWLDIGSRRYERGPATGKPIIPYAPAQAVWRSEVFPAPRMRTSLGSVTGDNLERVTMFAVPGNPLPCYTSGKGGMLLLEARSGAPMENRNLTRYSDATIVPNINVFMVGGFFGGTKAALLRLESVHARELRRYLSEDRDSYRLDDQHFVASLACVYPSLIEVVMPPDMPVGPRRWFFCGFFSRRVSPVVIDQLTCFPDAALRFFSGYGEDVVL